MQEAQLKLVQQEEKEQLEAKSLPLRNYLMRHVMPTLTKGLVETCKIKPEDPVDFLVSKSIVFLITCHRGIMINCYVLINYSLLGR